MSQREQAKVSADDWSPPRFLSKAGDYSKLSSKKEFHADFVEGFLKHYSPWTEIVAADNGVPSTILLTLIANEQVFYSHAERFAERFSIGSSIGLAQIKASTLHAHELFLTTSERNLKQALKVNSFNILAASQLLREHLETLCDGLSARKDAWETSGTSVFATDSFVRDILEGDEVCTAERVCALLEKPSHLMDLEILSDSNFGHCMMKASVAFWISGDGIIYRREIQERRPNTMKRARDGALLLKDFLTAP